MAQRWLSQIGSLTLNKNGEISLTNPPLTLPLQTLENEGILTIPRDSTYQTVEPYILDLLQYHDNRIYYQPNAIHDLNDGQEQFAALTMMRGLLCQFISREYRNRPFFLTLTGPHPSNIFADEDWHVTSLIYLEWACSFPVELQTPPSGYLVGLLMTLNMESIHRHSRKSSMSSWTLLKNRSRSFKAPMLPRLR